MMMMSCWRGWRRGGAERAGQKGQDRGHDNAAPRPAPRRAGLEHGATNGLQKGQGWICAPSDVSLQIGFLVFAGQCILYSYFLSGCAASCPLS